MVSTNTTLVVSSEEFGNELLEAAGGEAANDSDAVLGGVESDGEEQTEVALPTSPSGEGDLLHSELRLGNKSEVVSISLSAASVDSVSLLLHFSKAIVSIF